MGRVRKKGRREREGIMNRCGVEKSRESVREWEGRRLEKERNKQHS